MNSKTRVYVSVPVDMLTRKQAKKLQAEVAGVLDPEKYEPVFNRAAFDAPEDEPLRLWWHLSEAMLRLGKCDAAIFPPSWEDWPGWVCPVEQDAALRSGKRCLYTYRDSTGKLTLLTMGHCGGPEIYEDVVR